MPKRLTWQLAAVATAILCMAGCGLFGKPAPRKPNLYTVEGTVLDAMTQKSIHSARVMVRATIPSVTNTTGLPPIRGKMPSLGGQMLMTGYGVTDTNGKYRIELSEGYQIVRTATRIRIEASAAGYTAGSTELPAPQTEKSSYEAPDIILVRPPTTGFGPPLPK
jgi:hypothetical protein